MLSTTQINELHQFLQEDIQLLKLSGDEIPERVVFYLDNLSGCELLTEDEYQNLIDSIITPLRLETYTSLFKTIPTLYQDIEDPLLPPPCQNS